MGRSFSFVGESVLSILQNLTTVLPGIEKIVGIWYSPEQESLIGASYSFTGNEYLLNSIDLRSSADLISKLRQDSANCTWLRKDSLPFELLSKEIVQLDIYNEHKNNVLLIRIRNDSDTRSDLFFLYFGERSTNFGTMEIDKVLSTETKTAIAYILRNSIIAQLRRMAEDREGWLVSVSNSRRILVELNAVRQELGKMKEQYREGIIRLCKSHLSNISSRKGILYLLAEDAIGKLKEYRGDIAALESLMEKSASNAEVFVPDEKFNQVLISEYHIHFDNKPEKKPAEPLPSIPAELPIIYGKTLQLLDKLENAAKVVKSQNKLLTSANLGNEFPSPITPPAISDALRKHRSKILVLFRQYPNRWEVIRKEFRPVQNILNPRFEEGKLSA